MKKIEKNITHTHIADTSFYYNKTTQIHFLSDINNNKPENQGQASNGTQEDYADS